MKQIDYPCIIVKNNRMNTDEIVLVLNYKSSIFRIKYNELLFVYMKKLFKDEMQIALIYRNKMYWVDDIKKNF
jgi:hypothetical protein